MRGQCPLIDIICWGLFFLPDLPFPIDLLSRGDCRSALCCLTRHANHRDVVHSFDSTAAPTLGCARWAAQLPRL